MVQCPNNLDCDVQFTSESTDNGDGVYFSSSTVYLYSEEDSSHDPNCQPLTANQIERLEDEYNQQRANEPWAWGEDHIYD